MQFNKEGAPAIFGKGSRAGEESDDEQEEGRNWGRRRRVIRSRSMKRCRGEEGHDD